MKKQKLIAVAILFALISASAFNRAVAGDAFSELQNMVKNSNSAIAFDGAKVYSNSVSDPIVELEGPDYDKKDSQTTDGMEEKSGIASVYSKLLSSKVPTLTKDSRKQAVKEKVKTVVGKIKGGGTFGGALGLGVGILVPLVLPISMGAGIALGIIGGAAIGAAWWVGSYFYDQW